MRDMFNEREYTTMLRFYDADIHHNRSSQDRKSHPIDQ
jgi:hypothetical protein